MQSTFPLTPLDTDRTRTAVVAEARAWGAGSPYLDRWVMRGSELLAGRTGEVVLAYDPSDRLLSLDVFCGQERVFGMDDLL